MRFLDQHVSAIEDLRQVSFAFSEAPAQGELHADDRPLEVAGLERWNSNTTRVIRRLPDLPPLALVA